MLPDTACADLKKAKDAAAEAAVLAEDVNTVVEEPGR